MGNMANIVTFSIVWNVYFNYGSLLKCSEIIPKYGSNFSEENLHEEILIQVHRNIFYPKYDSFDRKFLF